MVILTKEPAPEGLQGYKINPEAPTQKKRPNESKLVFMGDV